MDRETKSSYRLEISATDGFFVASCRVSIEILDDNDSPPVCARHTYSVSIHEDANAGVHLLTVLADDADEGANAKQEFYLSGEGSDLFSIGRDSGVVSTALPLDRETAAAFSLTAHAQDAGMPEWECTSRIDLAVLDVNDNAPEWSADSFAAALKEDAAVGTVATLVAATDPDSGNNRRVSYALLGGGDASNSFRVDSSSGVVTLAKPLDREMRASYNLTVRAMDAGLPRLSSTVSLIVNVLDVNDNPPEFASKAYFATVGEDSARGAEVVRVLATSKDEGVNADITYSIVGGNQHRKFKVIIQQMRFEEKQSVIAISFKG